MPFEPAKSYGQCKSHPIQGVPQRTLGEFGRAQDPRVDKTVILTVSRIKRRGIGFMPASLMRTVGGLLSHKLEYVHEKLIVPYTQLCFTNIGYLSGLRTESRGKAIEQSFSTRRKTGIFVTCRKSKERRSDN